MNMNEKQYKSSTNHEDFIPQSGKIKTKNKPSKWLAVLLAMVMLVSGLVFASVPAEAEDQPGHYSIKSEVPFNLMTTSQNTQTLAVFLWLDADEENVYMAIISHQKVHNVKLGNNDATAIKEFEKNESIFIGDNAGYTEYKVEEFKDYYDYNKNQSHWTVAKFPISVIEIPDTYSYTVTAQGDGGHGLSGTYTVPGPSTPATTMVDIYVRKRLEERRNLLPEDTFSFKLLDENKNFVDEISVSGNNPTGKFPLELTEGEYTYFVEEIYGTDGDKGIYYDRSSKEVTIKVDKGNGGLTASVVHDGSNVSSDSPIVFTNTYKAEPVKATIKVKKNLEGRKWLKSDSFKFNITGGKGKNWINKSFYLNRRNQTEAFTFEFDEPGTYEYDIKEFRGFIRGITYDQSKKKVKIVVTDNYATGKLEAFVSEVSGITANKVAPTKNKITVSFTNTYRAKPVKATIEGAKSLAYKDLEKGEFTFALFKADENGEIQGDAIRTTTNNARGKWRFKLPFHKAGTYHYVVKEVDGQLDYIDYDEGSVLFEVVVTDNLRGSLKANVSLTSSTNVFKNTYNASGSWTPEVRKKLEGRPLKDKEFTFYLKDPAGTVSSYLQKVENAEDGSVPFDAIPYTAKDIGKSFHYLIVEHQPDEADRETGMKYDEKLIEVTVTVSDLGEGKLGVVASSEEEGPFIFLNEYRASGSLELEATKVLNGRDLKEDEFNFLLKNDDGIEVGNATNAQDGSIVFNLDFTQEDIGNTYAYTMEEEAGTENGMDYATNVVNVTVVVSDGGNGDLDFDVNYENEAVFTNTYEASVNYLLNVTKELTGGDLVEGEFEFALLDAEDNELQKVNNLASGQVLFDPLSFDQDDIGKTYTYKVRELLGDQDDIEYDDTVYTFTLRIEDLGEGALEVIYESEADELKFTNIKEQVAGAEETEDKGKEDDDTKEKVKGDEVKGDDDKKAPVSGEQASIYRYLSYVMLLLAASTVVLVRRFSKKEEAAE